MSEAVVIIGGGQAGAQLAISLRQGGYAGPVRLICEESYCPYQRPPLSKKFLAEYRDPDSLFLRPDSFWREQQVTLDLGAAVGSVEPSQRSVTLTNGNEIEYGALVFATGTSARALPVPGVDLKARLSVYNLLNSQTVVNVHSRYESTPDFRFGRLRRIFRSTVLNREGRYHPEAAAAELTSLCQRFETWVRRREHVDIGRPLLTHDRRLEVLLNADAQQILPDITIEIPAADAEVVAQLLVE